MELIDNTLWLKFYRRTSVSFIEKPYPCSWEKQKEGTKFRVRSQLEQSLPSNETDLDQAQMHMQLTLYERLEDTYSFVEKLDIRFVERQLTKVILPMNKQLTAHTIYLFGGVKLPDETLGINPLTPPCVIERIINPLWERYQKQ